MEYYNQNSLREYPFLDNSKLDWVSASFSGTLPSSAFVEARLMYIKQQVAGTVKLVAVTPTETGIGLDLIMADSVSVQLQIPVQLPEPNTYVAVRGSDPDAGITWLFVFGSGLTELCTVLGSETASFTYTPTFLPVVVRDLSKCRVISISDDSGVTVTGDVVLEEGYNCRIETTDNDITITPEIGAGAGLNCSASALGCGSVLFRLNGQYGANLSLEAGSGVLITPHPEQFAIDISAIPKDEC